MKHETLKDVVIELLRRAVVRIPPDVVKKLKNAARMETNKFAKIQLETILENIRLAEKKNVPVCQDTGITIFYVRLGRYRIPENEIERAILDGVADGTKIIPLRPNAVHPLSRNNPGTNLGTRMPHINFSFTDREYTEIVVMPKGAGSENMSALKMLTPSAGLNGIKDFVLSTVVSAGGNPCPPTIVGVGIGGSADIAVALAKEALLRPVGKKHEEESIAHLETELEEALNLTGIGPMGLGGKTTVLSVNIEHAYCHTASLPVAVNIQCWAARRASVRLYPTGNVEYGW